MSIKVKLVISKYLFLLLFFCIFTNHQISGQPYFLKSDKTYKSSFFSGIAMGVADMNGDHLDDLIILDDGEKLNILFQGENNHFFTSNSYEQSTSNTDAYSLCVGDFDNDFINDIMIGYTVGGHLYSNHITEIEYEFSTDFEVFVQGINFVDFDNDGLLDLYVSNDVALNKMYKNNNGSFSLQENWIDFATLEPSDNSGNYGSEWIDIDNDCDLDLYISKCRIGVLTPEDPRRINTLYINDGNNNYTESAVDFGLASGAQSWSTNFGDIDNDGDLDAFTVNHDDYFSLLENIVENDTFISMEDYVPDPLFSIGYEGMFLDVNNDTYLDIIITGDEDFLLINDGDKTFTVVEEPFGTQDAHSLAIGDLNDDGFLDVFTSYATEINTPSIYEDKVYFNTGNNNNYAKFTLTGITNNRNAIGSRISIYGDWGVQIREVKAGESYGISNSFTQHFGLGGNTSIDSIVVRWPDCSQNIYTNLSSNEHYFITEDGCITTRIPLEIIGDKDLCTTDSVQLICGTGSDYKWNTGETTASIITSTPGSYFCRYIDESGCMTWSNPIDIAYSDFSNPTISTSDDGINCIGVTIELSTEEADSYLWSTGETDATINISTSGYYSVTSTHGCSQLVSDTIFVEFLDSTIVVYNDTIKPNESAQLNVDGDSIFWFTDNMIEEFFHIGNSFSTLLLEESIDYYVINRDYKIFDSQYVGIEDIDKEEHLLYSTNSANANVIFDVFNSTFLKSVKVRTDIAGMRLIELKDDQELVIASKEVMIDTGTTRIELNFNIEPGTDYELGTNTVYNQDNLGFKAPRLWRENFNVQYPYEIENLISIKKTDKGNIYFYYFLDWEVQKAPIYCESNRTKISAIVDTTTSSTILQEDHIFNIYPNPVTNLLILKAPNKNIGYKIYDVNGMLVLQGKSQRELDISSINQGVYYIVANIENNEYVQRFIKIDQ